MAATKTVNFRRASDDYIEEMSRPELAAYCEHGIAFLTENDTGNGDADRLDAYYEAMGHDLVSLIELAYEITDLAGELIS